MTFHEGQRVVCVDASPAALTERVLRLGGIYTIRGIDPECKGAVYLHEVPDDPPPEPWLYPVGWRATRFRPLAERSTETGFAILRRIATDHKAPVREKALSSFRVTGTNT